MNLYTGQHCPECYNSTTEEPTGGVLGNRDGMYKCSNRECDFVAPLTGNISPEIESRFERAERYYKSMSARQSPKYPMASFKSKGDQKMGTLF